MVLLNDAALGTVAIPQGTRSTITTGPIKKTIQLCFVQYPGNRKLRHEKAAFKRIDNGRLTVGFDNQVGDASIFSSEAPYMNIWGESFWVVNVFRICRGIVTNWGQVESRIFGSIKNAREATEVNTQTCGARVAVATLRHLWRQSGVSLSLKGRVHQTTVRSIFVAWLEDFACSSNGLKTSSGVRQSLSQDQSLYGFPSKNPQSETENQVFGYATGILIVPNVSNTRRIFETAYKVTRLVDVYSGCFRTTKKK
ncbi:hypothetical protein CLF_104023, partial [Clonorchis sinensis]